MKLYLDNEYVCDIEKYNLFKNIFAIHPHWHVMQIGKSLNLDGEFNLIEIFNEDKSVFRSENIVFKSYELSTSIYFNRAFSDGQRVLVGGFWII